MNPSQGNLEPPHGPLSTMSADYDFESVLIFIVVKILILAVLAFVLGKRKKPTSTAEQSRMGVTELDRQIDSFELKSTEDSARDLIRMLSIAVKLHVGNSLGKSVMSSSSQKIKDMELKDSVLLEGLDLLVSLEGFLYRPHNWDSNSVQMLLKAYKDFRLEFRSHREKM